MTKARSITIVGGAYTMAAIALVALIDLFAPLLYSHSTRETLLIGLSFGQLGVAVLWASSAPVLTWRRVAVCYLVAVVLAFYFLIYGGLGELALIVTVWLAYPTFAIPVHLCLRWFRRRRQRFSDEGEQPPRFGVRHLLIASTVIAIGSLVVRAAIPEFTPSNIVTITLLVTQSALLALVAIEARRSRLPVLWQLGLLAAASVIGAFFLSSTVNWERAGYTNAVQASILALALVAPQLDRYTLRITLEPIEEGLATQPAAAEELTE